MIERPNIPKGEQLQALVEGLQGVYRLIERYTGSRVTNDFRKFINVSKGELASYLSAHPDKAEKHVISVEDAQGLHDVPVLFKDSGKWVVCWMDHGKRTNEVWYEKLAEAAADFLMAYW